MAAKKRPSFLKRQKEQQRLARAAEKREARRARKQGGGMEIAGGDLADPQDLPAEGTEETAPGEP